MQGVRRGTLLIADIGGYTNFLTAVELEHSTDILSDLIGAIVAQARGAFQLAKLEGDAVFCHAAEGSIDGPALITLVESCYFAFAERLRDIARASTCNCGACKLTPSLNLKFVLHHGEYVIHDVAGNAELVGADVINVHRLLKNHIVEATGKRGYAFFSQALVDYMALDAGTYELEPHSEEYDDVGEISGLVMDLQTSWQRHQEEQRVYVGSEDAIFTTEFDVPISPAVMWEFVNSPGKLALWGADKVVPGSEGPRGVGTVNHCIHGNATMVKQVLDWKPFRYVTESNKKGRFTIISTFELIPNADGGTHGIYRARPEGNALTRAFLRRVAPPQMRADFEHSLERLRAEIEGAPGQDVEPSPAAAAF
ncbi:MAG TPA: DUF2652 domain-containing protein [Candidatus Solibacter sp.]|jgi:hypothetical protein|nr:DUF2652 domain-containing protein [Candidatus Solibacter sp.]